MCLKYGRSQPKRAYKARAYKKKKCKQRLQRKRGVMIGQKCNIFC